MESTGSKNYRSSSCSKPRARKAPPAETKPQKPNPPPEDKKPEIECPAADAAEIGTLSPDGRKILESYELVDGVCKEVYRNVPVTEQLIKAVPSPYEAAQTASIAVLATTCRIEYAFSAAYRQAAGQKGNYETKRGRNP